MALQLSAAHGPVQSLERAAAVCDGWVFDRIRESLRIAQMQMHSPWDELRELAEKIGIPELGDVGAIMRSSGSEGAQVHETLRSRADSLRDQIRTDNLARAEGVTSRLDIPGSLLVFVLLGVRPLSVHRPRLSNPPRRRSTSCISSPICTSHGDARLAELRRDSERGDSPVPTAVIIVGLVAVAMAVTALALTKANDWMNGIPNT